MSTFSVSSAGGTSAYRVAVRKNGMYFVSASALGLSADNVVLRHRGQTVSTMAADGGFYFFGQAIDSPFTLDDIYQLSSGKGVEMAEVRGKGPRSVQSADRSFAEDTHFEVDAIPVTNLAPRMGLGGDDDYWFWTYFPEPGESTLSIDVHGPDTTAAAVLKLNVHGLAFTDSSVEHRVALSLNGDMLAPQAGSDVAWDGATAHSVSFLVPAGMLHDGANTVDISAVDPGVSPSLIFVDSLDLSYARYYRAVDDQAIVKANGDSVITVRNFTQPDLLVFDISNPLSPRHVDGVTVAAGSTGYNASFNSGGTSSRYLVTTRQAVASDAGIEQDTPSNLKDSSNNAEYLLIAADDLAPSAERLLQYRGASYTTKLVRLSDVFDEFNYGVNSPHAIHDFLKYAYQNWQGPPRFAVLVGDGSFDYRDLWGNGDNVVPTLLASTPDGLYAADPLFGDVAGDNDGPEIAISRLPVATDSELQNVIDKIIAYESGTGGWVNDVMLIADNADNGGVFYANLQDLRSLIPDQYDVSELNLGNFLSDIPTARQIVKDGFNDGKAWVNYIGHGGNDMWAAEDLLDVDAVSSLTNGDRPPIVVSATCNIARFEAPGYVTLAEALVLDPGGAVAAWSPSGRSIDAEAHILDRALLDSAVNSNVGSLGEAVNSALRTYAKEGKLDYLGQIYNLLGDAGLRLHKP